MTMDMEKNSEKTSRNIEDIFIKGKTWKRKILKNDESCYE